MKTFTLLPQILCISQLINFSCSNDCTDNNNRDEYLIIGKQIAKISEDEIILTSDQNSLNVDIKNIIDPQKKIINTTSAPVLSTLKITII